MKKLGDKSSTEEERGPRADMIRFIGKIFDEPVKTNEDVKTKLVVVKAIQRTISDMESDGVYFPVSVKESLRKKRDELTCEYSGLPAVSSYDE